MNRSKKYIEDCKAIADSLIFLQNTKTEKEQLERKVTSYLQLINTNKNIFLKFPSLMNEIQTQFSIQQFNIESADRKIKELESVLVKLTYMHDMLNDIEEIRNPVLEEMISSDVTKARFVNSANSLLFRSVDTLYFEMQHFEKLFKKTVSQLNDEKQKREKVRSLMGQDLLVLSQFPVIEAEFRRIVDGQVKGSIGADHVITNYPSIRDSLNKINEFSIYFSRLSRDYMLILGDSDIQVFQAAKNNLSLSTLSGEFMKLNSRATGFKNRMLQLDTLRNQVSNLKKEINEKSGDLASNHQTYVREEMAKIQELLFDRLGSEFEKAAVKINTIRDLLKKEFRSNDQRATDTLYIRQSISKYENNIWQEDLTILFEALNDYASGKSGWSKDDFGIAVQKFIKQRNETLESVKTEFELFFSKNREYKNRYEKIANTKGSRKELETLVNEMSSFKPLKNLFYKFIK